METVMAWYISVAGDEEAGPAASPLLCIRPLTYLILALVRKSDIARNAKCRYLPGITQRRWKWDEQWNLPHPTYYPLNSPRFPL